MNVETISRRYATALADVVLKTGETETVKTELKSWEQMIASNVDLQSAFRNPAIAHANKERVLEDLLAKTRPSTTTSNFLRVLLRNSRLTELGDINERFDAVLQERSGNVVAEVTSARELNQSQQSELKANLEKLTGKHVRLNFTVDPDLIGGVVTRIGSTIYDGSVKTQLENLKEELVNG
ncbi:MAG TPA: ATP synthase F1 subunit delta [Pyrinomonadaceae bacterium]